MRKVPEEERSWGRKADKAERRETMDDLRREVRRRSELTRLHRQLSRDYPGQD